MVPWVGVTVGYQYSRAFATNRDSGRFSYTLNELRTGVVAGLDLRLWNGLTIGPYIAGTLATELSGSIHIEGVSQDRTQLSYALIELGMRVGFGP